MYITLEKQDYQKIAKVIANSPKVQGHEYVEIGELEFNIRFRKMVDEHFEDDYENGTGVWVTDEVTVHVDDIKFGHTRVEFDNRPIEAYAEDLLK